MVAQRDTQRRAFYRFEDTCVYPFDPSTSGNAADLLSLEECREIVEHTFCEFAPGASIPDVNHLPPKARQRKRKPRPACFRFGGRLPMVPTPQYEIILPDWARSCATVLHEVSHALTFLSAQKEIEGHGPEFAATALALWRCYLKGPNYDVVLQQGVARGIHFAAMRPKRKVSHSADGPCILCGIEPRDPRWHSVGDIPFRNDVVRDDVLSRPTERERLQRIFELEHDQPGEVSEGLFSTLLRQIKDGALVPEGHPLRDHIKHHTSAGRYEVLSPGPRRTWVRRAIRILRENG